jgi:hypothetical protein
MLSEAPLGILRSYWRASAPAAVPVSGPHLRCADRPDGVACRLPVGDGRGGARQASERACSQLRRQLCAIAGYLRPQPLASKSSSALRATSASGAR